ncbi:MAG: endo-1,4-beta-xylanase [Bryobacterales bacterium]|nr:endo-1,4-beta-xylanase [Bryobacteraceae bacterium]MDW8129108.1 endo-1,4-beta-xylanase [Bryobacterales bacterium]
MTRRTALAGALAATFPARNADEEEPGLREYAARAGLLYGAAAAWPVLRDDESYARAFAQECSILVPENVLKMGPVQPEPGAFRFEPADFMAEFCRRHDMRMRGHTLLWHQQAWPWLKTIADAQEARKRLEEHILTVAGRYRGSMHSWDVVNEAVHVPDGRQDGLRKTPFLELLGSDYVELAFRIAHDADPQAKLTYNDYGLDYDTPGQESKRQAVLRLLRHLKEREVPIHAFGMQAHLDWAEFRHFNPETLQRFFREIAELGLEIYITELDVSDRDLPDEIAQRDEAIAKVYHTYLTAALAERAVKAVLTWGLTDRYTWLATRRQRPSGTPVRVLPLDRDYRRKPAWQAIRDAFRTAPARDG